MSPLREFSLWFRPQGGSWLSVLPPRGLGQPANLGELSVLACSPLQLTGAGSRHRRLRASGWGRAWGEPCSLPLTWAPGRTGPDDLVKGNVRDLRSLGLADVMERPFPLGAPQQRPGVKVMASRVRPPGGAKEREKSQLCWGPRSQGWRGRDPCTFVPWQLGGHQVQPLHPWWCPTLPAGPTRFPAELRGPSPSLHKGRTARANQQPFHLVPRVATAAGLRYTLRHAAPPRNSPPLRRPAHCGPRLPTPSLPTSPQLCPHQCCRPQGPGLSLGRATQRAALTWAGAGAADVGISMTDIIRSDCRRGRSPFPGQAQG